MAIPKPFRDNFNTLLRAAQNGDLALVECTDIATRQPRYVICAMDWDAARREHLMVPFGHLCMGNPYEEYESPGSADMKDHVHNPM